MGQNSIISPFFASRAKKSLAEGRSPPQELEVGPRSGPYLLVNLKIHDLFKSYVSVQWEIYKFLIFQWSSSNVQ